MNWFTIDERLPVDGDVIIAETRLGRGQVVVEGDTAYLWNYDGIQRDRPFCKVSEITRWRGCGGFDY